MGHIKQKNLAQAETSTSAFSNALNLVSLLDVRLVATADNYKISFILMTTSRRGHVHPSVVSIVCCQVGVCVTG